MKKLIWRYYYCNGVDGWEHFIPFEYSSKDDFVFMILEMITKEPKETHFPLLGFDYVERDELEHIEGNVYELDDWFNANKKMV